MLLIIAIIDLFIVNAENCERKKSGLVKCKKDILGLVFQTLYFK